MLIPMYCTNCGNNVTSSDATKCPYCEKPLSLPKVSRPLTKSPFASLLTFLVACGIASYFAFPDFWKTLINPQSRKEKPVPAKLKRTPETDKEALDALYTRYLKVLENPEPQKFREFVQRKRLIELNEGGDKSLIYDQLVPDLSMNGMEVSEIMVKGDRGIVVTKAQSAGVTDNSGNPVGTIGVAKCIYEANGWKIFSQTWHINSPTNPVEDSMSWLTPKTDNAAASELLALGVEFSEESCLDAISRSRIDVVKLCLKAGFNPNGPWMGAATAFDSAVSKIANGDEQNLETIKVLLAAGAKVDSTTGGALTPLMQAAVYCKKDYAEVFLNAGANINFKNAQGLTAIGLAENCPEVKELLEQRVSK
jgi:ankyrin repeat protein